jgi:hypothetical protein
LIVLEASALVEVTLGRRLAAAVREHTNVQIF